MSRNINPVPQYNYTDPVTGVYGPVAAGKMYYFKSGSNSPLVTYADDIESIPNTNPVTLNENGELPNVFFSGSARQILEDQNGVQIFDRDPVGGERELGDFSLWDAVVTYNRNDITEGSDGSFYISLGNANRGNDPTTTPSEWSEIRFLGVWNTNRTYKLGEIVQTSAGSLYTSQVNGNVSNDPATDSGTNWLLTNIPIEGITKTAISHFYRNR